MDLASRISDLQRQLEVKTAYLNVKVSFGIKAKGLRADVKREVQEKLLEICTQLAEGQEAIPESDTKVFTSEEAAILKQIVTTMLAKTASKTTATPVPKVQKESKLKGVEVPQVPQKMPNKAQIMLLDNIDPTLRNKLEPQAVVRVISTKDELAFVQDKKANRFYIPIEDLDFNLA